MAWTRRPGLRLPHQAAVITLANLMSTFARAFGRRHWLYGQRHAAGTAGLEVGTVATDDTLLSSQPVVSSTASSTRLVQPPSPPPRAAPEPEVEVWTPLARAHQRRDRRRDVRVHGARRDPRRPDSGQARTSRPGAGHHRRSETGVVQPGISCRCPQSQTLTAVTSPPADVLREEKVADPPIARTTQRSLPPGEASLAGR
jgi:hypothetical protein